MWKTRLGFNVTGLVKGTCGWCPRQQQADPFKNPRRRCNRRRRRLHHCRTGSRTPKYNVEPTQTCVYYACTENMAMAGSNTTATSIPSVDHFAIITADGESNLTVMSLSLPRRKSNGHVPITSPCIRPLDTGFPKWRSACRTRTRSPSLASALANLSRSVWTQVGHWSVMPPVLQGPSARARDSRPRCGL